MALRWNEMRAALADLRVALKRNQANFAEIAKLNRHTVRRVEDIRHLPEYRPDLETIAAWLQATSSQTVSDFLKQFESPVAVPEKSAQMTSAVTPISDKQGTIHPPLELPAHVGVDVAHIAPQIRSAIAEALYGLALSFTDGQPEHAAVEPARETRPTRLTVARKGKRSARGR